MRGFQYLDAQGDTVGEADERAKRIAAGRRQTPRLSKFVQNQVLHPSKSNLNYL